MPGVHSDSKKLPGVRDLQRSFDSPICLWLNKPLLSAFDNYDGVREIRGSFTQLGYSEMCLTSSQVPLRLLGDYKLSAPSPHALLVFLSLQPAV